MFFKKSYEEMLTCQKLVAVPKPGNDFMDINILQKEVLW